MATGAWRPSASVKLRGAEIPHDGVPLATSSEHPERRRIIELALAGLPGAERDQAVYVGDGAWDGRAARSIGLGFVGVGTDGHAARLSAVGASTVVPDFADVAVLLEGLERALPSRS